MTPISSVPSTPYFESSLPKQHFPKESEVKCIEEAQNKDSYFTLDLSLACTPFYKSKPSKITHMLSLSGNRIAVVTSQNKLQIITTAKKTEEFFFLEPVRNSLFETLGRHQDQLIIGCNGLSDGLKINKPPLPSDPKFFGNGLHLTALTTLFNNKMVVGCNSKEPTSSLIQIWDEKGLSCERTFKTRFKAINHLLTIGNKIVACSNSSQELQIWDIHQPDNAPLILKGHSANVLTLTKLSQNRFASGAQDHSIRIWDADLSGKHTILSGHTAEVNNIAVHSDGRIVSMSIGDGTIRVWNRDLSQKHIIYPVKFPKNGPLSNLITLEDGRIAFSGDGNGNRISVLSLSTAGRKKRKRSISDLDGE